MERGDPAHQPPRGDQDRVALHAFCAWLCDRLRPHFRLVCAVRRGDGGTVGRRAWRADVRFRRGGGVSRVRLSRVGAAVYGGARAGVHDGVSPPRNTACPPLVVHARRSRGGHGRDRRSQRLRQAASAVRGGRSHDRGRADRAFRLSLPHGAHRRAAAAGTGRAAARGGRRAAFVLCPDGAGTGDGHGGPLSRTRGGGAVHYDLLIRRGRCRGGTHRRDRRTFDGHRLARNADLYGLLRLCGADVRRTQAAGAAAVSADLLGGEHARRVLALGDLAVSPGAL